MKKFGISKLWSHNLLCLRATLYIHAQHLYQRTVSVDERIGFNIILLNHPFNIKLGSYKIRFKVLIYHELACT